MKAEETGNRAEAQRRVGNETTLKEICRELWTFPRLESCWQDVRYALRMLVKTPAFTLVAVVALALGIGADTAVFTIANGAFSWNLGLDHVDRVIFIGMTDASHRQGFGTSYPDFQYLRDQTRSLAGLAAYQFGSVNLSDSKTLPERYYCAQMSANGFFVSEQEPAVGRIFAPEDERHGAALVVVLSHHIWEDRYGEDPSILGKTIRVNDIPRTIVGVMPPGKRFPEDADLWTPLVPDARLERRDNRSVALFGRLANGMSIAAVRSELGNLAGRLAKQYPNTDNGLTADVQSIAQITGAYNMRPLFAALWAAAAFRRSVQQMDPNLPVYDIRTLENRLEQNRLSVTTLGGMFSVFAAIALVLASVGLYAVVAHSISQRTQEIGLRMAVGGTRQDIVRLVFREGMGPLIFGMALGLPAAFGVTHVLRMALIGVSPGDPLTFSTSVLVVIFAGILGCAIPARRAIQVDPIVALRYE